MKKNEQKLIKTALKMRFYEKFNAHSTQIQRNFDLFYKFLIIFL